eukprot:TRINITY_DN993_c0_g1_i2.p1 TRINITY_DN993_c0_g1~~TRINITY_DN993_c0_g1_i2.p1  ORF type:complete len:461 (-),score=105.13 TRINITY_DN993_c0_g1_i2:263-1645(-)
MFSSTYLIFFFLFLGCVFSRMNNENVVDIQNQRPSVNDRTFTSVIVDETILEISSKMKNKSLATLFENCYPNTLDTTVVYRNDEIEGKKSFIITGDINAMWLRDSLNQITPYSTLLQEESSDHLRDLFLGLIKTQVEFVLFDPYANAFNLDINQPSQWITDNTYKLSFLNTQTNAMNLKLHERKYELDSLVSSLKLSYIYYNNTNGDTEPFDDKWISHVKTIVSVIKEMQKGTDEIYSNQLNPAYTFQRLTTVPTDTLKYGFGGPGKRNGLVRSCFRPSDDATTYPYLTSANAFAVVNLNHTVTILRALDQTDEIKSLIIEVENLSSEINTAIYENCIYDHPVHGRIFSFEVDGYGNHLLMDDANVPSLLSLPYLGFIKNNDPLYIRTRNFILSKDNPYYFESSTFAGVGSPHTNLYYIWPMSLIVQAMTSDSTEEIENCLNMILLSSNNSGFLHESFFF